MRPTLKLFAVCLLLLAPALTDAQTRSRRSSTPPRRRAPAATQPRTATSDTVAVGRLRLAERIKIITEFLYVYGGIANQVELTEARARESSSASDMNNIAAQSRARLRQSLADVRSGLDQLETEFRSSPDLQRYYDRIAGVAAAAADAEEMAAANQLKPAGRKLLVVVNQLTDALAGMN